MDLQAVVSGTQESRVDALRRILDYPFKQRDPEGSRFWFLRPGTDEVEAKDTCPIAVGFYSELDGLTDGDIKQFLTADEQQHEIYGHYTNRIIPNQPVMYLLLPEALTPNPSPKKGEGSRRVAMILPTDGKLRQRQIQTFSWSDEDLQARLNRLRQDTLARTNRMKDGALSVIPLVEWAFYKPITTAKELAQKLAEVSRRIERVIPDVYRAEPIDGYLRGLLRSFQKELLPTLKLEPENEKDYSFADIYAQTIAYGLFTARVFSYTVDERRNALTPSPSPSAGEGRQRETDFNREDAWELLPETNPFLRRLFRDVSKAVGEYDREAATALRSERSDESPVIADELIDAISEVVSILRAAKMDAILEDFRAKMNREDIVIRFYEDFLAAYKPQMRERRGVYYTPEPVVSYMVRSVDILLKEKFNKPLGLADPEVMILDPACGTGTFLLWIFQLIHQRFQENPDALTEGLEDRSWSGYVKDRLLPRIFGFELLMAPYAIAHLKLGLFLEETGYQFDSGKRLGVYLTNTLEEAARKTETLLEEFIAEESDQASAIKREQPVMIVIGNPPYSINSENTSDWIISLIEDYKKGLNEKKLNLDDDYIKFIRFAQWRIQETNYGILAFISNNSYLDGITHRRMRESLIESFDEAFILDLHGSSKKKERSPDGSVDENIFDIQQGVSVGLFVKSGNKQASRQVKHQDFWGTRSAKNERLVQEDISITDWKFLKNFNHKSCLGSFFFFTPKAFENIDEYCNYFSVKDVFLVYQNGLKTDRDDLFFGLDKNELSARMKKFYSDEGMLDAFRKEYKVENSSSYDLLSRRSSTCFQEGNIHKCIYRPFDFRWLYYSVGLTSRPAWKVMQHMLERDNISLICLRQARREEVGTFLVGEGLINKDAVSIFDIATVFPLYLYSSDTQSSQVSIPLEQKSSNFSQEFVSKIKLKFGYVPDPKLVFYYIYAVLYFPRYRIRYAEFLKIDFPRIPLTSDETLFRQLAAYGEELTALHLMQSSKLNNLITHFEGNGNQMVDAGHPKYLNGKVIINKKGDGFTGVPEEVWNFYVGGYQVCQKWLKDRKGRTLSQEDITHYQRIIVALQETIRLMQQIDEAIPGFPLE
jgi:type I restriction-modification system DNA methylase subunit